MAIVTVTCDNIGFTYEDEVIREVKDPLEDLNIYEDCPKYYRQNERVFAEPIAIIDQNESNSGEADNEICFIDNCIVRKTAGKRNKYLINVDETSSSPKCPQTNCSKVFSTTSLLRSHIRRVHCAEHKYMCEHCAAGFNASYLLQRHMAVHGQQRAKCPVCGKMLSKRTNMSVHLRRHTDTRPHACQLCSRTFVRRATLNAHVRFVHRTGELRCHRCDERFSSRKLLTSHKCRPQ